RLRLRGHCLCCFFVLLRLRRPTRSTLFPYTTLFRSNQERAQGLYGRTQVCYFRQDPSCLHQYKISTRTREYHVLHLLRHVLQPRSEEHTSELQSRFDLVCRLLLEKKKRRNKQVQTRR